MNVLLLRWDTKPDKRIRGTFLHHGDTQNVFLCRVPGMASPNDGHRYILLVPPCFDVYVWVRADDRARVLSRFIDRYVDAQDPGDPRFTAFVRTFVQQTPLPGDQDALLELGRDPAATRTFSIYLHAKHHHDASVTVTEEGDLVLGIGLDDPDNSPQVWQRGTALMKSLRTEFAGLAGIGGVELAPPQSASEWAQGDLVQVRDGAVS